MKSYVCFLAIFAVILFVNLPTGFALKCFTCSTENDPFRCGDPFNSTSYVRQEACESPYNSNIRYVCRKVKYHRANNEIAVSRSCFAEDEGPCSQNQLSQYLRVEHCSTCTNELCNAAPTMFKISSLFAPVIVFLTKLTKVSVL